MRELMDTSSLDALVVMSIENVAYLTGIWVVTQRVIPDRLSFVLWPRDGEPVFIICRGEEINTVDRCSIKDVRTYVEFRTTPLELLAEALTEKGLSTGRLGIERRSLSVADYQELERLVPDATLEDGASVMEQVRMIKTPEECEALAFAANVTQDAIGKAFLDATSGTTEKAVGNHIAAALTTKGADVLNFMFLGCGLRSFEWHAWPADRPLETGDIVTTDVGGSFAGYWSDVARMAVVGKPNDKQRELYDKLFQIHVRTIEAVKPGIRASDLYRICENIFKEIGLPFWMAHIGHGLGLGLHERPLLNPYVDQELLPGMVLCIEPAHLDPGVAGYHLEDLVLVTDDGVRPLTDVHRWTELLVID
jgi:Xaa-Pro aminopeptidase